jgi:hypothetical protein
MKASRRRPLFHGGLRLFRLLHGLGNVVLPEHELALVLRHVPCRPDLREGSLIRTATASKFLCVAAVAWIDLGLASLASGLQSPLCFRGVCSISSTASSVRSSPALASSAFSTSW